MTRDPSQYLMKITSDLPDKLKSNLEELVQHHPILFEDAFSFSLSRFSELCQVLLGSEFAKNILAANPVYLRSNNLDQTYKPNHFQNELSKQVTLDESKEHFYATLREFRNKSMFQIIWRDLNHLATLDETMLAVTELADVCIRTAHDWIMKQFCHTYQLSNSKALIIIALGKLGGEELNLSSDIDLVFAYPDNFQIQSDKITTEQFYTKFAQQLIATLNELTVDGFVFRVDMRLRPFGNSGPIVMKLSALEEYYQQHGRNWERYAFVKARILTAEKKHRLRLSKIIQKFVYRPYVDYGVMDSLRSMKQLIRRETQIKGLNQDIKRGEGGIREIEFIIQSMQLIHGGRYPLIQQRTLSNAIEQLIAYHIIDEDLVNDLHSAYCFLRQTEHCLQAYQDRQTHSLPKNELHQIKLAYMMGYDTYESFNENLHAHRQAVISQFENFIAKPHQKFNTEHGISIPAGLESFDPNEHSKTQIKSRIQKLGIKDTQFCFDIITKIYKSADKSVKPTLDIVIALLMLEIQHHNIPLSTFERISRVFEKMSVSKRYLVLLLENPIAIARLLELCTASLWLTEHVSQNPILLEEFLNKELYTLPDFENLKSELRRQLLPIPESDLQQQMDVLRHFKLTQTLRIAAADVTQQLPLMRVSDYLTDIATVILQNVKFLAIESLKYDDKIELADPEIAIIGYGKLGGIELGYGSDLDLVFLRTHQDASHLDYYTRLAQRITYILNELTPHGRLYEVDLRLRPQGDSGVLVNHTQTFSEYLHTQAWTWEHQALVRARVISGSPKATHEFVSIRQDILAKKRDIAKLKQDVLDMRERILENHSSPEDQYDLRRAQGGIADIEFIVQFGTLAWSFTHPNIPTYTDNIRILESFGKEGLMSLGDVNFLCETYRQYRLALHHKFLENQPLLQSHDTFIQERARVRGIWDAIMDTESHF